MLVDGTWLEVVGKAIICFSSKNPSAIELVSFSMFCDILSMVSAYLLSILSTAPLAIF